MLSTAILTWAAVYAYVAWFCFILYRRQSGSREYLAFSLVSLTMAVHAAAGAALHSAESVASAALAANVHMSAVTVAAAWYVEFVHAVIGRPRDPLVRIGHGFAVAAVMLALAGALVDPALPRVSYLWRFPWSADLVPVRVLPVAWLFVPGVTVLTGVASLRLARQPSSEPSSRGIAAAAMLCLAAGLHDVALLAMPVGSIVLLDHAFALIALAMGVRLLLRFMQMRKRLDTQTAALLDDAEHLQQMETELVRQEQLAAVGELSTIIAEELRSPLGVIHHAVERLQREDLPRSDQDTLLTVVDGEADRLNRLVRDLLSYTRPVVPFPQGCSIHDLAERSIATLRAELASHDHVHFANEVPAAARAELDPELWHGALVNLLEHALQGMPHGGTVTIRAQATHLQGIPATAIVVRNAGPQTDAESRRTAPSFPTAPAHTGLGLAMVERIVSMHGGSMHIEAAPGSGTTVRLLVPDKRQRTTTPDLVSELTAESAE